MNLLSTGKPAKNPKTANQGLKKAPYNQLQKNALKDAELMARKEFIKGIEKRHKARMAERAKIDQKMAEEIEACNSVDWDMDGTQDQPIFLDQDEGKDGKEEDLAPTQVLSQMEEDVPTQPQLLNLPKEVTFEEALWNCGQKPLRERDPKYIKREIVFLGKNWLVPMTDQECRFLEHMMLNNIDEYNNQSAREFAQEYQA